MDFGMERMRVRCTFTEEVLGTASADPELHARFVASKAPDALSLAEEVEALGVEEVVEKGMTVFPKDKDGNPFLFDYQIKGFFKNAGKAFGYVKDLKLTSYKSKIDNLVFVEERMIPLNSILYCSFLFVIWLSNSFPD